MTLSLQLSPEVDRHARRIRTLELDDPLPRLGRSAFETILRVGKSLFRIVQAGADKRYFLYTYKCGNEYTRSFWRQQFVIFTNGLLDRNASGALIRVSTPVADDVALARQRAMRFLSVAIPHLDRGLR